MLTMQSASILLMRTIELATTCGGWPASVPTRPKSAWKPTLSRANKRLELKENTFRNQFMVITIDRLGNTSIKEPKREGPLRRLLRWRCR